MRPRVLRIREYASTSSVANAGVALLLLASSLAICAQSTASSAQNPAEQAEPAASAQVTQTHLAAAPETRGIAITQDELRQQLAGKTFYLRGGYLDNSLHFSENGQLVSSSPQASYTLSLVEIEKVHLDKHKVELEAVRYGLHFLGALPSEDPTQAADKVRLTPKKKLLKITIDREELVAPKKQKAAKRKGGLPRAASSSQQTQGVGEPQAAAANDSERPVGRHGVTTTTSAAHANQLLKGALDKIFAPGIDDRMISALPDYWKLYYLAAAAKSDYRPRDPAVLRQNAVDQKAKILAAFDPPSNEYAQTNGVAGIAMYHVVVSPEGKPEEIAVGRPIGFGLDENAVAAIRKASFQPAMKDGKPVPVMLDLTIQFRIYSKRTAVAANAEPNSDDVAKPAAPPLPGPYSPKQK